MVKNLRTKSKLYRGSKPSLKTTYKTKTKNDFAQIKDTLDYFIGISTFQDDTLRTTGSGRVRDIYTLYAIYNGQLPEEYFHYVTNPLNSSKKEHTAYPARIRSYSIIRPNIDLLLGEYDGRPFNYTVTVNNPESINHMEEEIYQQVLSSLEQQFINNLNQQGVDTGQESKEVELPINIKAKRESTYKDQRAIDGQNGLTKIEGDLFVRETLKKLFKDWLIAGEIYTYKSVHHDDMVYERVSPLDLDYDKSPDTDYIEDGTWAVRRMYLNASDILDLFYDEISDDNLDSIDHNDTGNYFGNSYFDDLFYSTSRVEEDNRRNKMLLYHGCFKTYEKFGVLSYFDELGLLQEIEVPEDYKPEEGETVEWMWRNVVWEGYRLDIPNGDAKKKEEGGALYFRIQECPVQRNKMNHLSHCKLPYNGKRFSDTHAQNISILELGIPYEILYIILHYKAELNIAKSKGKIAVIDINNIPKKPGWDEEKFFYWADANGFALVDGNQIGANKAFNQYTVLDMDMFDHIAKLVDVMRYIKQEWDDLIGFTPQRKGQTQASETASGIDAARFQSAIISERIFSSFEDFTTRELRGLLDCSKLAWIDGKKSIFYSNDLRNIILNIDPATYIEADFGVFLSNSSEDIENMKVMKQQVTALASQGAPGSMLAEVLQSKNISKLKEVLKEAELAEMQKQQAIEQSSQDAELKKLEIEKQYQQIGFEFDYLLQDHKYNREKEIALIKGDIELNKEFATSDINNNNIADINEIDKRSVEREKLSNERTSKQRENQLKDKELNLKNKEIESKERIEKLKSVTALKNKTSGEA